MLAKPVSVAAHKMTVRINLLRDGGENNDIDIVTYSLSNDNIPTKNARGFTDILDVSTKPIPVCSTSSPLIKQVKSDLTSTIISRVSLFG